MFTLLRWIVSIVILAMWCALVGTGLYVAMYEAPATTPEGQAIVVLGGNASRDGILTGESAERLNHAKALFDEGAAPLIVLTGGGSRPVARDMARTVREAGISRDNLLIDGQSNSTLQNALYTSDFEELDKTQPIILVTHRYHLPRAWASFRWAGFENIQLSAADADAGLTLDQRLLWEAVKWPMNILRATAASIAIASNVPRSDYKHYLQ
ncbi:MAG: YdcF family protein [Pseudomonadota bacterium]